MDNKETNIKIFYELKKKYLEIPKDIEEKYREIKKISKYAYWFKNNQCYLSDGTKIYLDGLVVPILTKVIKLVRKDWDNTFIYDGKEGAGKSVIAQQHAKICDPTLNIDRICFNAKEFIEAINKAKPYEAIIFDEAYSGLSSRAAISQTNRMLVSVLAEIRQKNLFVFIVLPCFFELDKYAAVWRSRGLFHVYVDPNYKRGYFSFYNEKKKKNLYLFGKRYYDYNKPKYNLRGRFRSGYVVDEEKYRNKKLMALRSYSKRKEDSKSIKQTEHRNILIKELINKGVDKKEVANKLGLTVRSINRILSDLAKKSSLESEMRTNIGLNCSDSVEITPKTRGLDNISILLN